MAGATFTACSNDDELSPTSVITTSLAKQNQFDKWLKANFVDPYNIEFKYRYDHNETDMNYYNVPADFNSAVKLAHIIKYACIETYNQVAGPDFTRAYFPKMLYATGDFEYRNNGTIILGTAEGGKKIFLSGTNSLDEYMVSREKLSEYYLKTIHHEFTHILNQIKPYPTEFQMISSSDYVTDSWSTDSYTRASYYLTRGFISSYSQHSHEEDFAELLSFYVCNPQSQWDKWLEQAGKDGAEKINKKTQIIRDYLQTAWNIDLEQLREEILTREEYVVGGHINLTDLSL